MKKENKIEKLVETLIRNKRNRFFVHMATLVVFIATIAMIPLELVKAKMLPSKDSDSFSIYVDLPRGNSVTQTKEVTDCVVKSLLKEQDITAMSVFLSEGQPLDFAGMVKGSALKDGEHEAEIMVNIKRKEERDEMSYNLIQRIRPIAQQACTLYEANIKFIELPAGPPVLASVVAEIYGGKDFESRSDFAHKVASVLASQPKLVDVDVLADAPLFRYKISLNSNKVLESGIGLDQVKKMLYVAFEGFEMGIVNKDDAENQIPIFLKLKDGEKFDANSKEAILEKLADLKLMNQTGMMIPMSTFVTIEQRPVDPTLTSKDLNQMVNVIAETDMESQIYPLLDARNAFLTKFDPRYEVTKEDMLNLNFKDTQTGETYQLVWDGELKVTIDTFIDLGGAFIGALVLIFFIMVVYYKNFALAGGIVVASFVSLFGVIIGHWVMDLLTRDTFYLTATSLIGYIGLIGINSRNSLLIIDFSKQLIRTENMSAKHAIAVATATRAKPILLTVLAIVFASSLLATDAVFGGLGVALIGGTLAAYLVSLFLVPTLIIGELMDYEASLQNNESECA